MKTYIGLVRGINVGGNKIVKMAQLKAVLEGLGYQRSRTLLQSGNFVIDVDEPCMNIEADVRKALAAETGVDAEVFVFTLGEWRKLIENNPFPQAAETHPQRLIAMLTRGPVGDVSDLEQFQTPSERVKVAAGVLYLDLPDGIGTSKMLASKPWCKLTAAGTVRNWNTITKLLALAET